MLNAFIKLTKFRIFIKEKKKIVCDTLTISKNTLYFKNTFRSCDVLKMMVEDNIFKIFM